jgi:hypothetical protein
MDLANALYGKTKPSPPAAGPAADTWLNTVLYDGNKATPPVSMLGSAIDQRRTELVDAGLSAAEIQQTRATFIDMAAKGDLDENVVRLIAEHHIGGLISDTRPVEDAAGPSDEDIAVWNAQNRANLRIRYGGVTEGDAILDRTRRFVRARPALARVLQAHGLGSRPEIVEALASHVFSNGIR